MRFNYTRSAVSAELVVPMVVSKLSVPVVLDFDGKIDTGADITIVPSKVRQLLNIKPERWTTSRGALGEAWQSVPLFYVRIRVAGGDWIQVMVTESPKDYILIGRDILNRFILTAHGPAGWFELELPAPAETA